MLMSGCSTLGVSHQSTWERYSSKAARPEYRFKGVTLYAVIPSLYDRGLYRPEQEFSFPSEKSVLSPYSQDKLDSFIATSLSWRANGSADGGIWVYSEEQMYSHAPVCLAYQRREFIASILRKTGMLVFREDKGIEHLARRCSGYRPNGHQVDGSMSVVYAYDATMPPPYLARRQTYEIALWKESRQWLMARPAISSGSQEDMALECDIGFPGVPTLRDFPACMDITVR
jgi:hypothetical protein